MPLCTFTDKEHLNRFLQNHLHNFKVAQGFHFQQERKKNIFCWFLSCQNKSCLSSPVLFLKWCYKATKKYMFTWLEAFNPFSMSKNSRITVDKNNDNTNNNQSKQWKHSNFHLQFDAKGVAQRVSETILPKILCEMSNERVAFLFILKPIRELEN